MKIIIKNIKSKFTLYLIGTFVLSLVLMTFSLDKSHAKDISNNTNINEISETTESNSTIDDEISIKEIKNALSENNIYSTPGETTVIETTNYVIKKHSSTVQVPISKTVDKQDIMTAVMDNCGHMHDWIEALPKFLWFNTISLHHEFDVCHSVRGVTTEIYNNTSRFEGSKAGWHSDGTHVAVDHYGEGEKGVRARFYLVNEVGFDDANIVHEDRRGVAGRIWETWK
ncbi:MAG: hypothetical protein LBM13_04815 [Candidatus Ancillula sp.]|jgi:hypothetical protein|nr:hypothetical protein [Candidatus Ancillula sp.]